MSSLRQRAKGAEFVLEAEALKLEGSANRQKDMVALGSQRSRGRLCQVGVGLQGFVEHLSGKGLARHLRRARSVSSPSP